MANILSLRKMHISLFNSLIFCYLVNFTIDAGQVVQSRFVTVFVENC